MNTTKASQCVTSQCNVTDVVDCGVDYSYRYTFKPLQAWGYSYSATQTAEELVSWNRLFAMADHFF